MIEIIKSPGIAVLLSMFIPGAGSIYSESIAKGILYFVSCLLFLVVGAVFAGQGAVGAGYYFWICSFFFWIWSIVAAYKDAKRFNLKKGEEENEGSN